MNFHDPAILSALIQAGGAVIASSIAAIAASLLGKRFVNQKYLKERLVIAQNDIAFLLAVEEAHCRTNKEQIGTSCKRLVRESIRKSGMEWSGKFVPSRSRDRLQRLGIHP